MLCPFCQHRSTKVVDSRSSKKEFTIRRRRQCLSCGQRFTTKESIVEQPVRVVKKDGSREDYDRKKLRQGLELACKKRPVSAQRIDHMVTTIENDLLDDGIRELSSTMIGLRSEELLKEVDQIAFVRFRTVHRGIDDLDQLADEIDSMRDEPSETNEQRSLF